MVVFDARWMACCGVVFCLMVNGCAEEAQPPSEFREGGSDVRSIPVSKISPRDRKTAMLYIEPRQLRIPRGEESTLTILVERDPGFEETISVYFDPTGLEEDRKFEGVRFIPERLELTPDKSEWKVRVLTDQNAPEMITAAIRGRSPTGGATNINVLAIRVIEPKP